MPGAASSGLVNSDFWRLGYVVCPFLLGYGAFSVLVSMRLKSNMSSKNTLLNQRRPRTIILVIKKDLGNYSQIFRSSYGKIGMRKQKLGQSPTKQNANNANFGNPSSLTTTAA